MLQRRQNFCQNKKGAALLAKHGSPIAVKSGLGRLDFLNQLGNDLVQIADNAVGGNVEDGGVLVLVDGDDVLGILHTGNVLDGTGDAQRNVDAGMHGLAGLTDLMVSGEPALIGDGTGSTDNTAQTSFSALFLMSKT